MLVLSAGCARGGDMVPVLGAGAVSWQCAWCRCWVLAVHVVETGCRVLAPLPVVSAGCARCGGAVSWLCRLRTFLFQPVACQEVVGFCLAIWVYAGVIL